MKKVFLFCFGVFDSVFVVLGFLGCAFWETKKSSGRVLLIHFLEVVLMFKSSVVLSLVEIVESVLKTDRLAVVSCVRIS